MKPTQGKEITYFIKAFVKNIKEHSKCERRKYPEHYEKPAPTDTIIDEATANLLTPTIRRVARNLDTVDRRTEGSWVPPDGSALLPEERQLAAFTRELKGSCYDFLPMYHDSFFNLQVIEALLLHGEMAPLLRVCAHSDAAFAIIKWLSAHACGCGVSQD
jgi:hypothetical protein